MAHWTMYYRQPDFDSAAFEGQDGVPDSQFDREKGNAGWYKVDSLSKEFYKFKSYAAFKKYIDNPVRNMHVLRVVGNPEIIPKLVDRFDRTIPKLPRTIRHWRAGFDY